MCFLVVMNPFFLSSHSNKLGKKPRLVRKWGLNQKMAKWKEKNDLLNFGRLWPWFSTVTRKTVSVEIKGGYLGRGSGFTVKTWPKWESD